MTARSRWGARRGFFLLALLVLILDQASKLAVVRTLSDGRDVEVIPGLFDLSYSLNRGGLFGYFGDLTDPWRILLLTVLPLIATVLRGGFLMSAPLRTADSQFVSAPKSTSVCSIPDSAP